MVGGRIRGNVEGILRKGSRARGLRDYKVSVEGRLEGSIGQTLGRGQGKTKGQSRTD